MFIDSTFLLFFFGSAMLQFIFKCDSLSVVTASFARLDLLLQRVPTRHGH